MSLGLIGKKVGMTHLYQEDGNSVAVTVIDVTGNEPVQIKKQESDGYTAVQIGFDDQKEQRLNKPANGHLKKNGVEPKRIIREFRLEDDDQLPEDLSQVDFEGGLFQADQWVDVVGTTKGKGFQGVVRRHGFGGLPQTHGSMMHRRPGGIGAGTWPGRVWKNKAMPGRMGGDRRTVQNLKVVAVRSEEGEGDEPTRSYLLVSGPVPGAKGSYLVIRPAKKKPLPEEWPTMKKEKAPEPEEEVVADEAAPAEEAPAEEAAPAAEDKAADEAKAEEPAAEEAETKED